MSVSNHALQLAITHSSNTPRYCFLLRTAWPTKHTQSSCPSHSTLPSHHFRAEYDKIDQDDILNTILLNSRFRVAKEARTNRDPCLTRRQMQTSPPRKMPQPKRRRTPTTWRKSLDTRTSLQRHTTLFVGTVTEHRATRSNPPNISLSLSRRPVGKGYKRVNTNRTLRMKETTERKKWPT